MNKYETLKGYKDEEFRRITGVKRATFFKNPFILFNQSGGMLAQIGKISHN